MNSIWNNNIKAFSSRFPGLAQMFQEIIASPEEVLKQSQSFWKIDNAKNGEVTITENGIRLHSGYNPTREAQTAVTQVSIWEKSTSIFMGFGLGYYVLEWVKVALADKAKSNTKLVLIEPEPVHFFAALLFLDWTKVFKIPQLILAIACPTESIVGLVEDTSKINTGNSGLSDSYLFNQPIFTNHAKSYFDIVKTLFDRNITKNQINAATLKKFGKLWTRNCKKNEKQLTQCRSISEINCSCNKFILVAAGPSLENLFPKIEELHKTSKIICVETALRALLNHNIQPDFIILLDPQYWAYRHIAGLHAPESILITEVSAYPSVFRFNCKEIMLCKSQLPQGQELEQKSGLNFVDLGAGGSVASAAWNFAKYLGATQIYLAGLDLSYPGKQTHIKGSSAEQTFHTKAGRLLPVEQMNTSALFSANAQIGQNYNNEPVLTDAKMKMFAWWFESRIAACPEIQTYTLSPEGLKIPGVLKT